MTKLEADQFIRTGTRITVRSTEYGEIMTIMLLRQSGHNVYTDTNAVYDRADLEVIKIIQPRKLSID